MRVMCVRTNAGVVYTSEEYAGRYQLLADSFGVVVEWVPHGSKWADTGPIDFCSFFARSLCPGARVHSGRHYDLNVLLLRGYPGQRGIPPCLS